MSETQMSHQWGLICVVIYLIISLGGVQAIQAGCLWLYSLIMLADGWLMQAYKAVWACTALYFLPSLVRDLMTFWNPGGPNCWACVYLGFVGGVVWSIASIPVMRQTVCYAMFNITAGNTSMPGQ